MEVITFDNAEQMLHVIVSSPSRGWQVKGTKAGLLREVDYTEFPSLLS